MKTWKEIMVLGTQLGKMNIAAWASKEGEEPERRWSFHRRSRQTGGWGLEEAVGEKVTER